MNRPFVLDKELISQSLLQKKNRKGYDITNADTTLYFKILLKSVINLFKSLMDNSMSIITKAYSGLQL